MATLLGQAPDISQASQAWADYCSKARGMGAKIDQDRMEAAFVMAYSAPDPGPRLRKLRAQVDAAASIAATGRAAKTSKHFPGVADHHFDSEMQYLSFAGEELGETINPATGKALIPKAPELPSHVKAHLLTLPRFQAICRAADPNCGENEVAQRHRELVSAAIERGEDVPAEVVAAYPQLQNRRAGLGLALARGQMSGRAVAGQAFAGMAGIFSRAR